MIVAMAFAFADVIVLRVTMPARLEASSVDGLLRALEGRARSRFPLPDAPLRRALGLAERVCSHLPRVPDTCLYRSLARFALLSAHGRAPRFVMGLRRGTSDVEGHAWVELDGDVFGEPLEEDFVITYSHPVHA